MCFRTHGNSRDLSWPSISFTHLRERNSFTWTETQGNITVTNAFTFLEIHLVFISSIYSAIRNSTDIYTTDFQILKYSYVEFHSSDLNRQNFGKIFMSLLKAKQTPDIQILNLLCPKCQTMHVCTVICNMIRVKRK